MNTDEIAEKAFAQMPLACVPYKSAILKQVKAAIKVATNELEQELSDIMRTGTGLLLQESQGRELSLLRENETLKLQISEVVSSIDTAAIILAPYARSVTKEDK